MFELMDVTEQRSASNSVADLGWFLGFHGTPLSYNKAGRDPKQLIRVS